MQPETLTYPNMGIMIRGSTFQKEQASRHQFIKNTVLLTNFHNNPATNTKGGINIK
jgi:hypothetical protein